MGRPLDFEALLSTKDFEAGIRRIEQQIKQVSGVAEREAGSMDGAFKNMALSMGAYFSADAIMGFTRELINVRGEFQKTEIAFGTMLGSTEKAKALMGEMVQLAAKTPFALSDVTQGAKQLLAFQVPANEVVDTLTRLGNIASGVSVPIDRVVSAFGKVKATGRLQGDEMNMFMEAGIPIMAQLAKVTGHAESEIKKLVSDGKIGFEDVKNALFDLTNAGGMFYNLMEAQSASLSGKIANLGDAFDQMLNSIGEDTEGFLSSGIEGLTTLVENYEKVIQVIGTLVATYGTYKAVLIAVSAIQKVDLYVQQARAAIQLAQGLGQMTKAQLLFNAAANANPYVLMAGLIATVIGAVVYFKTASDDAKDSVNELNQAMEQQTKLADEENAKLKQLYDTATNEAKSKEERLNAVKKLQAQYPSYFANMDKEAIMAGKAKGAYLELRDAILESAKAKAIEQELTRIATERFEHERKGREAIRKQIETTEKAKTSNYAHQRTEDRVAQEQRTTVRMQQEFYDKQAEYLKQEKFLTDKLNTSKGKTAKLDADREAQNKTISTVKEDTKKKKKDKKEKATKDEPIGGSLGALEKELSAVNERLNDKTLISDDKTRATLLAKRIELEKRIAEVKKLYNKQSFDEEITELERQWKLRYQIAEKYGQQTADAQFTGLGESYYSDIENKFKPLDDKVNSGVSLSEEEIQQWAKLKDILNSLTGEKDPFTNWKESLDAQINALPTYTAKLDALRQERDNLTQAQKSSGYLAEINQRIANEEKAYQEGYNKFLEEHKSFEQKREEITKNYADLRAKAQTEAEHKNINEAESNEQTDLFFEEMQKSEEWAKLFVDMNMVATEGLENFKTILQQKLAEAKGIEAKAKIGEFIGKIDDQLRGRNPFKALKDGIRGLGDETFSAQERIAKFVQGIEASKVYLNGIKDTIAGVESLFEELGLSMDNAFGDFLDKLNGVSQGLDQVGTSVAEFAQGLASKNPVQMVSGAVKAIGGVIKTISSLFNGDKKKERAIKREQQILSNLKNTYEELSHAINRAFSSRKYSDQTALMSNLRQQQQSLRNMIDQENSKKKTDHGKIAEWQSQINAIDRSIRDLQDGVIKDVLQTDLASAASQLGDALVDAFARGENSAKSLEKVADDMVKNIVKNQLNLFLQKRMENTLKDLLKATGLNEDGTGNWNGISESERARLKAQIQDAGRQGQAFLQEYADLFSDVTGTDDSLKGSIQGMSEETAGVLAGQFNAIRINTGEILKNQQQSLDALRNSVLSLVRIEQNTANLFQMRKDLQELNAKVKGDGVLRANGL